MNRNDDIESVLSPWMSRQGRSAPDDLLLRVMSEVDTMSQESRTIGMGMLRFSPIGWLLTGVAVLTIAVAAVIFIVNLPTLAPPSGASPVPSQTPAASPTQVRLVEPDPAGDATGDAPDILAATATVVGDELTLEIMLSEPMSFGQRLVIVIETNGFGPNVVGGGGVPIDDPTQCNGWFMEESISVDAAGGVTLNPSSWRDAPHRTLDPARLEGSTVTISISRSEIGSDDWLTLYIISSGTAGESSDWLPAEGECMPIIVP